MVPGSRPFGASAPVRTTAVPSTRPCGAEVVSSPVVIETEVTETGALADRGMVLTSVHRLRPMECWSFTEGVPTTGPVRTSAMKLVLDKEVAGNELTTTVELAAASTGLFR